jgi:hypothetical protein
MHRLATVAALCFCAGPALAGPACTSEPKHKWISESEMKAKLASQGYKYKVFKVTSGNCYEIYGQNDKGQRVEIYFHPITGAVVEEHRS